MPNAPELVAILNLTTDSFSDGGRFLDPADALAHARTLAAGGADWLELGPASSHPDAALVPPAEQIARLDAVFGPLREQGRPLSVDATQPAVLAWALDAGVEMVNDVRGFPEPATWERLASSEAKVVVVHSLLQQERASREAATPTAVLDSIDRFFDERMASLVTAGVDATRLILDPGMGFFLGSDPAASVAVLRAIPRLRQRFGCPVFISVSRKSFLRALTGTDVRDIGPATLAAELAAARLGADYLRTHDPTALRDGLAIEAALAAKTRGTRDD